MPETSRLWRFHGGREQPLLELCPRVFVSASVLILAFVVLSLTFLDTFSGTVTALQHWIADRFGWMFVLTVNVVLGYLVYLALSPYGRIRLGGDEARPEFTRAGWLAMLFSAGMGIGLMFYGVAEPMYHLANPPHGAQAYSTAAYEDAIKTTFLHWGLHAWGIYTLMALSLAYFAYNRHQPLSIRSIFEPLLGDRIHGWAGHVIDTTAAVATLFGVATSLGLGVIQVNAGLNHVLGVPVDTGVQVLLIIVITAIATLSVVLGLTKGIKRLSTANMWLAGLLLCFIFVVGPTIFILNGLVENVGLYLDGFFRNAFWNETYTRGNWQDGWTIFYWGWWIAWAPFVGMFIARISKGRTIREFIATVLLVSTLITFVWITVFGDSAMYIELSGPGGLADAVSTDLARSLFVFLEELPKSVHIALPHALISAVSILACIVVITFFVTSSDSGSLVIDIITAGGHHNPPVLQRVYWASIEGIVAAILLVGGGLTALQTAAISSGLPFMFLLLLSTYCLHKALKTPSNACVFADTADSTENR